MPFGPSDNPISSFLNLFFYNCYSRMAVPIFFVASGFFLYRKTTLEDFSPSPTKAYVIKILKLYIIWTIIYFPRQINTIIKDEKGIAHGGLIFIRDCIFDGSFYHLWYLPALIFAVVLISFLLSKRIKMTWILIVAGSLYAVGLFAQSWFGIIEPLREQAPQRWAVLKFIQGIIVTTRDGAFFGFLFVGIGAYFAFYGFEIQKKKALMGLSISALLMFLEAWYVKHFKFALDYSMYVFLVPLTYFTFALILNWRIPSNSRVFKVLRILSSLIFFTHLWIKWFIKEMCTSIGFQIEKSRVFFILTVVFSTLVSFAMYRLSEYPKFKWLKKLYS
jgi:serine/alanine racemase